MNKTELLIDADPLIRLALKEDIDHGDISTAAVAGTGVKGCADLIAKQDGIIAGLGIFERVFKILDEDAHCQFSYEDGDDVRCGDKVGIVNGNLEALLSGERTALNYLQKMSGIATYTNQIVKMLDGSNIKLVDTRKTVPNFRIFAKYAVRCGGGYNHRYNLSSGVMLKDNHINAAGGIDEAVSMVRDHAPFVMKIEVETENISMVREALDAGADIIMLDNMNYELMAEAVDIIGERAEIECSGNVTEENISICKDLGIDYISSGAITHSASALDFSMKNLRRV